jgi:hypothetical protein
MFIFGGSSNTGLLNDLHIFDLETVIYKEISKYWIKKITINRDLGKN